MAATAHEKSQERKTGLAHSAADKKSNRPGVNCEQAVEEALCFGWIDRKAHHRNPESFYLLFATRNPKSKWSELNKQRVKKLPALKKMAPAGMEMVYLAKKTGTWEALSGVQQHIAPRDLQETFAKNPTAADHFEKFPPSAKSNILEWISNAKRPETREKRISETVALAAKNIRANQYQPKDKKLKA
jgi:uncharacterized protein YdeI (YjbR/CyaY-like superfamily)